ncbi:hypothetical protein [Nocardia sp. CA-290969]|uniref:hypothetical protein n=1 Tax=Nocardia sp. CA-290969 TaxID=3239986 RepID=UPI003D91FA5A
MSISQGALTKKIDKNPLFGKTPEERQSVRLRAAESGKRQGIPPAEVRKLLDMLGLLDDAKPETPQGCRVCGGELKAWTLAPKAGMKGCCSRPCRAKFLEGSVPAKAKPPVQNTGRCTKCGVSTFHGQTEEPIPGGKRYGGRGMCAACYAVVRRAERKADAQ